jgi:excinuclease UvrABC helicase subunit UvrB
MKTFLEYSTHRVREHDPKKLELLFKALTKSGLFVADKTDLEKDPHLFVQAIPEPEEFEGIRIYILGNICAYRVQKLKDTEPYGKAYFLDVQKMYDDAIKDIGDAGDQNKKIYVDALIKKLGEKLQKFYKDSVKDEEEFISSQIDGDNRTDIGGAMLAPANGGDYANKVTANN